MAPFHYLPDFCDTLNKALTAKRPSESAKSSEYLDYQQHLPIYDGRFDPCHAVATIAPPVQLFHPVFAHFLDDLASDVPVPAELTKAVVPYMKNSPQPYKSKKMISSLQFAQP